MKKIKIGLGARSYSVFIGTEILNGLPRLMDGVIEADRVAIVTDSLIGGLYLESLKWGLREAGIESCEIIISAGEEHKDLATIETIFDNLIAQDWDRWSPLIALGGGIVGDITGFAAASFMRGIPYIQVPTTLLAMVDSSVGGKTGVNHPRGKNLIGAFYQPRLVAADVGTLKSLPPVEIVAAMAEVIKYGMIGDAELFDYLETHLEKVLEADKTALMHVIARCCEIKAAIVEEDEREAGIRAILNFGHTIGHAIEQAGEYRTFRHGEAVALGMIAATELSHRLGYCKGDVPERLKTILHRAGLPERVKLSPADILKAVKIDKKRTGTQINFIFVDSIGKAFIKPFELENYLDKLTQFSIFR
jgi:3-dehydroquinate synthase